MSNEGLSLSFVFIFLRHAGITSKLEYIKELGVGAVWLSPIFKSPMVDFGYDIANFYEIHHEYGTMEDFEALLKKANELGEFTRKKYKKSLFS